MAKKVIEPGWGANEQLPNVILTLAQFCLFAVDDLSPSAIDDCDDEGCGTADTAKDELL
ncbi:MAG TPA: hypothetical protein VNO52_16155 [Methylomirabilota bacterium]|nr:hypothetical protein [Methylomirabilota bacterium]